MNALNELCQAYEEFAVAGGQRAVVVRLASSFFVLRGSRTQPLNTHTVSGPFDTGWGALGAAQRISRLSYMQAEQAEVSP